MSRKAAEREIFLSKFNDYARKVDKIAQAIFAEYTEAENALKEAEAQARKYPKPRGAVDYEYAAKAARAQADLMEARNKLKKVQERMASHNSDIAAIRKELAAALDAEYSADPSALDSNTLELLKSGILRDSEYVRLMNSAAEAGNTTMMRIIGKYAADAEEEVSKKYGKGDQRAMNLRAVAYHSNTDAVGDKLGEFDVLAGAFQRTTNNTAMIGFWGKLTGSIIENF